MIESGRITMRSSLPWQASVTPTAIFLVILLFLWYRRWRRIEVDPRPRTVLITGAASGIGRALAEELVLTHGDSIIALDRDKRALNSLQSWALQNQHDITCIECDVGDAASLARAVKHLDAMMSGVRVHAIVNLAGIYGCGPMMEERTLDKVERVLRTNVVGTCRATQAFHHLLPTSSSSPADDGRILLVGSEMAERGIATGLTAPYTMCKWALESYGVSLRQELQMVEEPMPVHVCMVSPGAIKTCARWSRSVDLWGTAHLAALLAALARLPC